MIFWTPVIVFVMLKLAGLVAWSWWWVGWIPLWLGFSQMMTPPD